jgi:3-dehydroquinate synthase II
LSKSRELIISPKVSQGQLPKFLQQLKEEGINMTYLDPKKIGKTKINLETIFPSPNAKHVVIEKEAIKKQKGKKIGKKFEILSNEDIENVLTIAKKGLDFVIVCKTA